MSRPGSGLRVLMTADPIGGVWTHALALIDGLAPHGVDFDLAVMGGPLSRTQQEAAAARPNLRLHGSHYRLEWMEGAEGDLRPAGEWLLEIERQCRPDLVHHNGFALAALPWRAPVLVGGHSCVLSWFEAVRGSAAPAEWDVYRMATARGLAAADAVVAPTRWMLSALDRYYGPIAADTLVIPNGYDPPPQPSVRPKAAIVLSAGRLWDDAKNLALLDRVARDLTWPVFVAGSTRHPAGGEVATAWSKTLGELPPADLAEWFAAAAIYASPARYEPFGLAVLEAAAAGCALVLSDIPSLRETWDGAACFAPADDPAAFGAALQALIDDPGRRGDLGIAARRRARRFSATASAEAYLRLYSSLEADRKFARRVEA